MATLKLLFYSSRIGLEMDILLQTPAEIFNSYSVKITIKFDMPTIRYYTAGVILTLDLKCSCRGPSVKLMRIRDPIEIEVMSGYILDGQIRHFSCMQKEVY